jgi:hypothetical protein
MDPVAKASPGDHVIAVLDRFSSSDQGQMLVKGSSSGRCR